MEGKGEADVTAVGPGAGLPAVQETLMSARAKPGVPFWPRKDRVRAASSEAVLFSV